MRKDLSNKKNEMILKIDRKLSKHDYCVYRKLLIV